MQQGKLMTDDPMETRVCAALQAVGLYYEEDGENPAHLDFYIKDHDLYIEVKQFHSARIGEQMSRAPNVIVAQGALAVEWLSRLIESAGANAHRPIQKN